MPALPASYPACSRWLLNPRMWSMTRKPSKTTRSSRDDSGRVLGIDQLWPFFSFLFLSPIALIPIVYVCKIRSQINKICTFLGTVTTSISLRSIEPICLTCATSLDVANHADSNPGSPGAQLQGSAYRGFAHGKKTLFLAPQTRNRTRERTACS